MNDREGKFQPLSNLRPRELNTDSKRTYLHKFSAPEQPAGQIVHLIPGLD
jgi:hypothetical protein